MLDVRLAWVGWTALALLAACATDDDARGDALTAGGVGPVNDDIPEDIPTGQGEPECFASRDCDGADSFCTASFSGDRSAFQCSALCLGLRDESKWCSDNASCCDDAAICSSRGYCELDGDAAGTGDGGAGAPEVGTDTDAAGESGSTGNVDATGDTG